MAASSYQPRSEVGQLVRLSIKRDGGTLSVKASVANLSGGRRSLAQGASVLDSGTGAVSTSEALAEGEGTSVHETGRVSVCVLSSTCTGDLELGLAIMSPAQRWRRNNPGAEFPVHQNDSSESEAKSKTSKRAKHGPATLAKAHSSGSQSAVESEDSSGGEELGGELREAFKEMARLPQAGKADGKQAQTQQKEESSEKGKKKSKRKQKKKRREGSEILAKEDRPGKKWWGRGRGKGRKAEKE